MNNMGGIIRCELLPVSSVESFVFMNGAVAITLKAGEAWNLLPCSTRQTQAAAPPDKDEGGTRYAHQFSTLLPTDRYKEADSTFYAQCCRNGCLVRYTDANQRTRIVGSKEYPLTGTFEEVSGESAADLAGYRIELTATCLHPQLIYKE